MAASRVDDQVRDPADDAVTGVLHDVDQLILVALQPFRAQVDEDRNRRVARHLELDAALRMAVVAGRLTTQEDLDVLLSRGGELFEAEVCEQARLGGMNPKMFNAFLDGSKPAIESAAYYVVAEALTNVAKYSGATSATIRVRRRDDVLVVEVADDGRGGAEASEGSGLGGLKDRVEALDGTFVVESTPGAGTRVRAELPLLPERSEVPA